MVFTLNDKFEQLQKYLREPVSNPDYIKRAVKQCNRAMLAYGVGGLISLFGFGFYNLEKGVIKYFEPETTLEVLSAPAEHTRIFDEIETKKKAKSFAPEEAEVLLNRLHEIEGSPEFAIYEQRLELNDTHMNEIFKQAGYSSLIASLLFGLSYMTAREKDRYNDKLNEIISNGNKRQNRTKTN